MIKQRTKEWYASRIGKFTASGFSNLMAKPRDKSATWSRSALNYIEKAAAQLYYNDYYARPDNDSTRWGMIHEDSAIKEFSRQLPGVIEEAGFMEHPEINCIGATPDAFFINDLEERTVVQVKCPYNQKNHQKYIEKISNGHSLRKSKSEYFWQIQGEIWITGADFGYFVSFDPRITGDDRLHYVKVGRDEVAIDELEYTVLKSLEKRDEILQQFRIGTRYPKELFEYW